MVEPTQDNCEIKEVAGQALETRKIFYACGISSEALDRMEKAAWVIEGAQMIPYRLPQAKPTLLHDEWEQVPDERP